MTSIGIKKNKEIDIDEKMLYSSTGLISGSVIMGLFSNISHEVMHYLEDIIS